MSSKRIGVFVCHCGSNIAGVIDVASVAEYASALPHVVHAETDLFACSEDGIGSIERSIRDHGLDRIVVAACTPRTHEQLFKEACEEAGINRHLLEFVSIREHCSWVHQSEPSVATEKAKELLRMAVARVGNLTPLDDMYVAVGRSALVVGGGVAGMTAAVNLASQGIEVHLVEREKNLGGLLRRIDRLKPLDTRPGTILKELTNALKENPSVSVYLATQVTRVSGSVGDFSVELESASRPGSPLLVRVGTIIVATGADELKPLGLYGYGKFKNVITELELEQVLGAPGDSILSKVKDFVFINCVGARTPGREYCGRICCMTAMKNAQRLKSIVPSSSVTVLERDTMSCGVLAEEEYRRAREAGVRFLRYDPAKPPRVLGERKARAVTLADPTAGKRLKLPADMVILTTPLVPQHDAQRLSNILKIPLGQEGFFLEAHVKLRPVEFSNDGIYVCGSARFPASSADSISQAYAAAAKAAIPIRRGKVAVEPIAAYATEAECTGCGACVSVCPYNAVELERDGSGRAVAVVTAAKCKGCGCCLASCPAGVMEQRNWSDFQLHPLLNSMERSALPGEPKVLVFACNWCSYAGADLAGASRCQIPHNVRVIRVMCSSRVKAESVIRALTNGIDGVMVLGCHPGECHYVNANLYTRRRAVVLKRLLELAGIAPERFRLDWVSASEGRRYAEVLHQFVQALKRAACKC